MKKNYFYLLGIALVTMLSFSFISCGDDDDDKDDGIDTTPIKMVAGADKIIQGADTISSSNRFVAYGLNNTVHAWHVGETSLLVNDKKTISITVSPQYYLYDDPVCEWGCSMDYVKSHQKEGTFNSKSTEKVLAYDNAGGATLLAYMFEDNKLTTVMAMVSTNHTSTLGSYLAERFLMIPMYQGEKTYFAGVDGIDVEHSNTFVYMDMYNTKTWEVAYIASNKANTRSSDNIEYKKRIKKELDSFMTE